MALNTPGIATDVAALIISGVTVKNLGQEPQQVQARDCPILFPDPDGFAGASQMARKSLSGMGPTGHYWEDLQPLTWRYLHAMAGSERGFAAYRQALLLASDAIKTAFIDGAYSVSGADVRAVSVTQHGTVTGPSGKTFFGFLVTVTFWQQINQ